jgi:hypothetical protein
MASVNLELEVSRHTPLNTTKALQRIRDAARNITINAMLSPSEQERAIQAFSTSLQPRCHRPAQAPVKAPGRKPKPSRAERYERFFRHVRAITYDGPSLPVETSNTGLQLLLLTVVALGKARIANLKSKVREDILKVLEKHPAQFLSGQLSRCALDIECTSMDCIGHKDSAYTKIANRRRLCAPNQAPQTVKTGIQSLPIPSYVHTVTDPMGLHSDEANEPTMQYPQKTAESTYEGNIDRDSVMPYPQLGTTALIEKS